MRVGRQDGSLLFRSKVRTTRAGRYSVVWVLVDLSDGPSDLDLDALGPVTAAVSAALDQADPVRGRYTLEVSTPGAERPLTTPRHFRRAVGAPCHAHHRRPDPDGYRHVRRRDECHP